MTVIELCRCYKIELCLWLLLSCASAIKLELALIALVAVIELCYQIELALLASMAVIGLCWGC